MRFRQAGIVLALTFCGLIISAKSDGYQQGIHSATPQAVTLYPPKDKATGQYDETRACYSFKLGSNKPPHSTDWDLGYGFASISNEDWLMVGTTTPDQRSVMKELGEYRWGEYFNIPALEPLPMLKEGERREITVDSSADTHEQWAKTTSHFVKAKAGYMYLVHVKDNNVDFYVLFRVEEIEQGDHCRISWQHIPAPEK
ncbi:MAG TPA: hypothetical protein VJ464_01400 [Blastocatellia bacterium]|nr:hypothetical protein [Blastocatellia bacterium]